MTRTVVVGTSVAGVRVATGLRTKGSADDIVLIGAEHTFPYDKPCLSKAQLAGTKADADNAILTAAAAAEMALDLRLGTRAEGVDLDTGHVLTGRGPLGFDRLVIATGARARTLPWTALRGVHVLRTSDDCVGLRSSLEPGSRLLIVGGGFIGCEVAATARDLGIDVVLVEPSAQLVTPAGPELGAVLATLHRTNGVELRLGLAVQDLHERNGGLTAELSDGSTVQADTVLVGIGAVPNVEWLDGAGLDQTDGVGCDAWGRVIRHGVAQDSVFAVGDVAAWTDPATGRRRRVEHWTNAVEQAAVVVRVVRSADSDTPEATDAVPAHVPTSYVWSDQYDRTVHMVGRHADADRVDTHPAPGGRGLALVGTGADDAFVFGAVLDWPRALLTVRRAARDRLPAAVVGQALEDLRAQSAVSH